MHILTLESETKKGDDKGKHIIDTEPSATISTTKIHKDEHEDPEEGGGSSTHKCG